MQLFAHSRALTVQTAGAELIGREESTEIHRYLGQTLMVWHVRHVNFVQGLGGFAFDVFAPAGHLKSRSESAIVLFSLYI